MPLYCSFCGKSQHEVEKLIAGPTVFICNGCTDLCKDIVDGKPSAEYSSRIKTVAVGKVRGAREESLAYMEYAKAEMKLHEDVKGIHERLRALERSVSALTRIINASSLPDREV